MGSRLATFLKDAAIKAADEQHGEKLRFNIGKYDAKVKVGRQQFTDLAKAKKIAKNRKWEAIEHLDRYLVDFETKFKQNGGEVIWAKDAAEAAYAIRQIAASENVEVVVKSKSMVTEEIHLNKSLESMGIQVFETDLGEYIVQMENSRPYHIVTPVMQKSKEDVAAIFHKKHGTPANATPQFLTGFVRDKLRPEYVRADMGITGGNFLIADTGSVVVTENEGNARLSTGFPRVHVAVVGIEKMIPSIDDLQLFLPLLATHGTGQKVTVYNSVFSGPRQAGEENGPEKMYVVLLDNGRTDILAKKDRREALYCIRCGACLNTCPVYQTIGGHAYETTYTGPIGSVISPFIEGKKYNHLSEASSLCGSCSSVCPVNIDIHGMLLINRQEFAQAETKTLQEKWMWGGWKTAMLSPSLVRMAGSKMKRKIFEKLFSETWGKDRSLPEFPKETFTDLWKKGKV